MSSTESTLQSLLDTAESTVDKVSSWIEGDKSDWQIGIQPYRTYGSLAQMRIAGRVLRNAGEYRASAGDAAWSNLASAYRHFESDEIAGATVEVVEPQPVVRAISDLEGYFFAEQNTPTASHGWNSLNLRLHSIPFGEMTDAAVTCECLVPEPNAEFLIISDIDDTVLKSEVGSFWKMMVWSLLHNAYSRLPLEGTPELYRDLSASADTPDANPVFYVSSSPWNLYPMLTRFMDAVGLPKGPIQLRDLGVGEGSALFGDHSHKGVEIGRILETYPQLPAILLGDSGQQDAQIYRTIAEKYPGRILCSYIRDVGDFDANHFAQMKSESESLGTPMLLVSDSDEIRRHAASEGWIRRS